MPTVTCTYCHILFGAEYEITIPPWVFPVVLATVAVIALLAFLIWQLFQKRGPHDRNGSG